MKRALHFVPSAGFHSFVERYIYRSKYCCRSYEGDTVGISKNT